MDLQILWILISWFSIGLLSGVVFYGFAAFIKHDYQWLKSIGFRGVLGGTLIFIVFGFISVFIICLVLGDDVGTVKHTTTL